MTKFKVGDKVRILDVGSIWLGDNIEIINGAATVEEVNSSGRPRLKCVSGMPLIISASEMQYIEKLPQTPTKNQRITTLESEVAELKAKVEALEKAQNPSLSYEGSAQFINGERVIKVAPTYNEQRKAIIAEAKAFVAKYEGRVIEDGETPTSKRAGDIHVDLHVNAKKRITTAIVRWAYVDGVRDRVFAKCAPDDVFNADIGKAIALGRALGLDVSRFEQAVKPTEVVVGQVVHKTQGILKGSVGPVTSVGDPSFMSGENGLTFTGDKSVNGDYVWAFKEDVEIIDDTEAQY